ncbi:MAG: hypothetical protein K6F61_08650 [Clostridiales bacterium]|nr:hypothetical protein [Clostridiales bacterium]
MNTERNNEGADAVKGTDKGQLARRLLSDSAWSIAGLALMNMTAQFAVYPVWNRVLGNEAYGRILYLIAGMNILAISMGVACNYARMKASAEGKTENRPYSSVLLAASCSMIPWCLLVALFAGQGGPDPAETALLIPLGAAVMWRFYADVEYRLSLNYKGFFAYYLAVSAGYGAGVGLFLWLKLWPLALLPGELLGIALVYWRGTVLKRIPAENPPADKAAVRMIMTLLTTEVIGSLILNGDRLLLNWLVNAIAVTVYYQASLAGKITALVTTPLNSVLIGYLSRVKGGLTKQMMNRVTAAAVIVLPVASALCTAASHLLIRIFYPLNYDLVSPYFLMASVAHVACFVSSVAATVLLRFCKTGYQLYINLVYAGLFIVLCIPGTLLWQVEGLCAGMMTAGLLKLVFVLWLGYKNIK